MASTSSSFTGLMLMMLVILPDSRGACPRPCACYAPAEVHCTFRSLVSVPAGISSRVQRINLGFNTINHITDVSFSGLRRLELLMMHGNNVQKIPDGAFQDLVSLQILKMSYNKLRVITGHALSGLTVLVRLHLDHNRIEFIHPDAFSGMTSLRLLHLDGNHLQKLHPATFSTFSLFQSFHISTLKHLYLSDNLLSTLSKQMLENTPQLENIFLYGNPWSCDCRMSWLQGWRSSGVMKCKKDRSFANGQLCPRCSSPKHLTGKDISDVKDFICSGPSISSSGNHISHEENISELLPIDRIKTPFGNLSLSLSDEHGAKADLLCQILEPRDSTKISWNYTRSHQIAANMTLFFDVECSIDRENYESLWRLLAYYSEVPVHLRREIMLTKDPEISYRYRQDIEKDAFYYTGVRADVLTRPAWLMQSFMNIRLNRPYSSSKSVRLILNTHVSTTTDEDLIRQQKRSWVMIEHDNKTQTTFSSMVGGLIEMKCVVHSSEDAVIRWMLPDGSRINAASSTSHNRVTVSNTGKLHIKYVDHSDAGVYYCIAEVVGDIDIVPFRLVVVDSSTPLQGEEIGSALTRFVGESAALPCVSVAAPDAVLNWIFPDGSILNSRANLSRTFIFSNGTLLIPYSQLVNNGYHKCVAMNEHGVDVMATKLTVLRRKGIEPLRPYPSKPQSAAGVSTRVKAFLEDVEEASGDDSNLQEQTLPNRTFNNQGRRLNTTRGRSFGHGRHRRPFRKDMRGEQNKTAFATQRNVHTKNKIDPQKWADILAKIREKTTPKNEEDLGLIDNTEGSSPNEHAFDTQTVKVTAQTEEENKNIKHTTPSEVNTSADKVIYITSTQSVSNYVITEINLAEERHVGTISGEQTENNQMYSRSALKPQSERENELNFSKTGAFDSDSPSLATTSTSRIGQETPPARNHLSFRQRFGSRWRKKYRRPFSKFTTSRPRSTSVTLTMDQTTQTRGISVYSTTEDTVHIYPTNPTEPVYPTSRNTAHIYPTNLTEPVYPTPRNTAHIYPTNPTEPVYPTPRNTAHIYPTNPTEPVYPTPRNTAHIYPTNPTEPVYPTPRNTAHIYSTNPTEPVYPTPRNTAHIYPTNPTEPVYPTPRNTAHIYPTNPTEPVYPTPRNTAHIYSTNPTEPVYPTPRNTAHIYPTNPTEPVYPTPRNTAHIYPTNPTGDTSVHQTSGMSADIYPTVPSGSVYPSTEEADLVYPTISTEAVYLTSAVAVHINPTGQKTLTDEITGKDKDTPLEKKEDGSVAFADEKIDEHMTVIDEDQTSPPAAGHVISLTTALQTHNSLSDVTESKNRSPLDVRFLPESHSDVLEENNVLTITSSGDNVSFTEGSVITSVQENSRLQPAENLKNQSVHNQVSFPLTTEVSTKSIISVGRRENNEIFDLKSVSEIDHREQSMSTGEKSLILSSAFTDSLLILSTTASMISIKTTSAPSVELPTTTTTPSTITTKTSAVHLTPGRPLQNNRIPLNSRNPETNYIEARKYGQIPSTNNRYPYYYSRNPSSSSVDLNSVKNIQTTTASSSSSINIQSNLKISGESLNRKWSEVLAQPSQTLSVQQMRARITTDKHHTLSVNAGSHVQMPCDSVGDPKPVLSWTKLSTGAVMSANSRIQRFQVQSNGTFVIRSVQLQDRGQYLCIARNRYGFDKMTVTLVVLAHVPRVTLPRHGDLTVYLGSSAVMDCQAQGLPAPNISWVLPDRSAVRAVSESEQRIMLFSNGTLRIKHTNYLDRGVYKCIASNAAGADTLSVKLHISALPPMIHQPRRENCTVPDGQAVYIHCTSDGSPSPAVRWVTFTGTQIRPSQFINGNLFVFPNGTLYIPKPTEKDSGNYECVAVNSVGVATRTVSLQVKRNSSVAKIIFSSSQNTHVQYGGHLSLDCTATGNPNPRIIWRTPAKKLLDVHYSFDGRMKVFSNGSLTISPVTERDEGDYLCVARNKIGDDYLLLKVKVMMKAAKIQHKPQNNHKVLYGGELKVDCIASGLPNPEIAWSLPDGTMINSIMQSDDGAVRHKRYVVFDNGTLYFSEVDRKQEGDYMCYAQNRMGKDEMKVHIKVVADVPVIQNKTYRVIRVPHGQTAVLTCSAKGKPAPTITWTSPANRLISPVSDKHQLTSDGTLHVHKVQRFDTGNYTCSARNIMGMDRKVIHVEVLIDAPVINGLKESPGSIRRTVLKDQHVLLDCRSEGNPVPQITWVLPNNTTLPAAYYSSRMTVHRNGTLDIRAVHTSDSGVFLCMARNEGGEAKLRIQLDVTEIIEKPRLRGLPVEHISLTDGISVMLNCSVDSRPAPEVTWILPNGTSLLRGSAVFRFYHKPDGTLLIREPSVSETGRYRCVGRNSAGYVERMVMLESSRKPDILNSYSSLVSIINGENLQLNCQSSGNPQPKLTWTLPNGVILTRPQQTGRYAVLSNGTLTVYTASVYDRGIYVCQTTNRHGSSSLTVSVIVIAYPPRITSGLAAVTYARPGVTLQLHCLALATPKAEVIWEMPDGIQFKVDVQPRLYGNKYLHPQGSLIIQSPSKNDNGLYKCTAKNVVGTDSRSTYLYVF